MLFNFGPMLYGVAHTFSSLVLVHKAVKYCRRVTCEGGDNPYLSHASPLNSGDASHGLGRPIAPTVNILVKNQEVNCMKFSNFDGFFGQNV